MKNINKQIIDKSKISLVDLGKEYKVELTINKEVYNEIMSIKDPIRTNKIKEPTTKEMVQTTNQLLIDFIKDQNKRWDRQEKFNKEVKVFMNEITSLPTIKKELNDQK